MISDIQYKIAQILIDQRWNSEDHMSAANVAMWRILQHPYFQDGYQQYTLQKMSDTFFRCVCLFNDKTTSADPLNDWYNNGYFDDVDDDNNDQRVTFSHPPVEQEIPATISDIPQGVWDLSQQIMDVLEADPTCLWLQDPKQRQQLTFEWLNEDTLNEGLNKVLGPYYHASLAQYGISYHLPARGGWGRDKASSQYRYLVCHNGAEVAAVLGVLEYERDIAVCYVSTNPAFRQQGLSKRLYHMLVDECIAHEKILLRTSPGKFTQEHPEITKSYDALLGGRPVLYAPNDSAWAGFLSDKLKTNDYHAVVAQYHPTCVEISALQHETNFRYRGDDEFVAALRQREQAASKPKSSMKA